MSFTDDFDSIAGTITDSFKSVWTTLGTKPTIPLPPVSGAAVGSGVGSALQPPKGSATSTTIYIIVGAIALVLIFGLLVIRPRR
jgi:hypothetical protein